MQGKGVFIDKQNLIRSEGTWHNNKLTGISRIYWEKSKDLLETEFEDGLPIGKMSVLKYGNGNVYEGELKDYRIKHGYGILTNFDKSHYEGQFKEDKKEGQGILKWPTGDYYQGWFL